MSKIITPNLQSMQAAIAILRQGGLVALPTETVYGLAADATNADAVSKIFVAKGRPAEHPLIVHIGDINQLKDWAIDIPASAYLLASTFWPGPLTLILKKHPQVDAIITGGQETIGIRIPNHPVTLAILQQGHLAVAAPSANRHCQISPTTAADVEEELGNQVDLIIDGGPCSVGLESTILNLTSQQPEILRPGMISPIMLSDALSTKVLIKQHDESIRVSGSLKKHYSPKKPVLLIESIKDLKTLISNNKKAGIMAFTTAPKGDLNEWEIMSNNPIIYAQQLYHILRKLDHSHADIILIVKPPIDLAWEAIHDRLERAAAAKGK